MNVSPNGIEEMSYADFVGFMGQQNTPPGGIRTIERWIQMSNVGPESNVLDLACSTGFSSRAAVKLVGCRAKGIDISALAIATGNKEAKEEGTGERIEFQVGDACAIPFKDGAFTHVFAGSTFGFIQDRRKALRECRRVLGTGGTLCIGNFYYETRPPETLLDQVEKSVGFRPQAEWTHGWWDSFFRLNFSLKAELDDDLPVSPEEKVSEYVRKFIYESAPALKPMPDEVKAACFSRLRGIRLILNEHRKYQRLNVSVWNPT